MWFTDDIAHVLQGLATTAPHLTGDLPPAEVYAYRAGFEAALFAVAVSFGIVPAEQPARRIGEHQ